MKHLGVAIVIFILVGCDFGPPIRLSSGEVVGNPYSEATEAAVGHVAERTPEVIRDVTDGDSDFGTTTAAATGALATALLVGLRAWFKRRRARGG